MLTLAATGTEMNRFAVVQNHATQQKLGYRSDLMYPGTAFLILPSLYPCRPIIPLMVSPT